MALDKDLITATQTRLAQLGFYRLRIDGVAGTGTEDAVIRFKEANGLRARAFIGPVTSRLLWSDAAKPWAAPADASGLPWLAEARALLGTREVAGKGNNPVIMKWAIDLDQWYTGDDVPWCGLFAAHCMAAGAPDEPQDFNRLGARNWLEYGRDALDGADPERADLPLGGVAVFWRTHKTKSWNGHVAPAITGANKTHLRVIGGNQSDNVTEAWFPRSRLLGVRFPHGFDASKPAPFAATGNLSTSEA
ncbi:TIGR02594 family protein [Marinovum sp. SP66]|uniref:NlpC/P60 family protein n=1 Tax=Marinovum TaxID=367771 RepID=UPI00237BE4D4|nr:TIGR02594 family protein [Marinovum sp. SP66]MDD9740898.1 TIGR02594 family protein [Marinovum sp. SP66]